MATDEFDIIRRHFNRAELAFSRPGVSLGIGDDCALVAPEPGMALAMSMDLLQEGVHFLPGADPYLLGQRTLLVNLSDLAAMGAEPLCFTLGLGLCAQPDVWLERFSAGLAAVATDHNCPLVGGDLIACGAGGATTVCIQVQGQLPAGAAIRRDGAHAGDLVFVTGTLGDAAAGLRVLKGELPDSDDESRQFLADRFFVPRSRVEVGIALRGQATAAIDISDGLVSDLGHILQASGVGAVIELEHLPLSPAFLACIESNEQLPLAVAGGDDYELCFTAPADHRAAIEASLAALNVRLSCIGRIEQQAGLRCTLQNKPVLLRAEGYNHFRRAGSDAENNCMRNDK